MLLACVKDVAVCFRGAAVTGAGFNLISDFEAVSVMSNRGVCCEATDHLGSKGQGVSGGFEPGTTIEVGRFHAFCPGVVLSGRGPLRVQEVLTNISRGVGGQVIPVFECIVCELDSVEFKSAKGMGPAFHFRGGSEVTVTQTIVPMF